MTATVAQPLAIDASFTAPITRDQAVGGWTIVRMPDSGAVFGTRRPVKVAGTIDGHPFAATMLPVGDGTHLLPIKAKLRAAIGKGDGETVTVHLDQRFS